MKEMVVSLDHHFDRDRTENLQKRFLAVMEQPKKNSSQLMSEFVDETGTLFKPLENKLHLTCCGHSG